MLTCIPQSFFSWNYRIVGASAGPATITIDFIMEQGGISLGDEEFSVSKQGMLSGHWSLVRGSETYAEAQKSLLGSFEVRCGDTQYEVKVKGLLRCRYEILADNVVVGSIRPTHLFTRRAAIECSPSVPEPVQLFSLWLVALMWRRAANSSS